MNTNTTKKRSSKELNDPDYNYYLAYRIEPTEKNLKKIEDAMKRRKNDFTQGTVVERRLNELYSDAVEKMNDPILRNDELLAAKKFKSDEAKKTIAAIKEGRGMLYKSDLTKVINANGKWLTYEDTLKDKEVIDDTKSRLDFSTYEKIENLLKKIDKRDLYDFLDKNKKMSVSELREAVKEMYGAVGKRNSQFTAKNEVCGEAKKIFKDDCSKKFYDIYLATVDVWNAIRLRSNVGILRLEREEFLYYSEKAKSAIKNITDIGDIENLLAEGLYYFHITIVGKADDYRKELELFEKRDERWRVMSLVKQHIDRAKYLAEQNNEDGAIGEINKAFQLSPGAMDDPVANQILSMFPTRAPDSVNAAVKKDSAVIRWVQNNPQKSALYTVIRKNGEPPTSIGDGRIVASGLNAETRFFEDKKIVPGTPCYYAVYSSRLGLHSPVVCAKDAVTAVTTILYKMDITRRKHDKKTLNIKIVFQSDGPVFGQIPELELIYGKPKPRNKQDGKCICTIHSVELKGPNPNGKYKDCIDTTIKSEKIPSIDTGSDFMLFPVDDCKCFVFKEVNVL